MRGGLVSGQGRDFFGSQMSPCAGRQTGQAHVSDADAGQFPNRVTDGRKHSAHLSVTAFKNGEFHFGLSHSVRAVAFVAAAETDSLRGLRGTVFQIDAPAQNV